MTAHQVTCEECNGRGSRYATVPRAWGPATIREPCPECLGNGWIETWSDDDPGVSDRHWSDVVGFVVCALICLGSVLYLMWLDGAIGGAS